MASDIARFKALCFVSFRRNTAKLLRSTYAYLFVPKNCTAASKVGFGFAFSGVFLLSTIFAGHGGYPGNLAYTTVPTGMV